MSTPDIVNIPRSSTLAWTIRLQWFGAFVAGACALVIVADAVAGDASLPASCGMPLMGSALAAMYCGIAFAVSGELARLLKNGERYWFCVALAIAEVVLLPIGTIPGLFTLGLLASPSTRSHFAPRAHTPRVANLSP